MIRLALTDEQRKQARSGYVDIAEPQARELYRDIAIVLREASGRVGGRPPVLKPCRYCGVPMGFRARSAHETQCRERVKLTEVQPKERTT